MDLGERGGGRGTERSGGRGNFGRYVLYERKVKKKIVRDQTSFFNHTTSNPLVLVMFLIAVTTYLNLMKVFFLVHSLRAQSVVEAGS